jgi:hypothetical protein
MTTICLTFPVNFLIKMTLALDRLAWTKIRLVV